MLIKLVNSAIHKCGERGQSRQDFSKQESGISVEWDRLYRAEKAPSARMQSPVMYGKENEDISSPRTFVESARRQAYPMQQSGLGPAESPKWHPHPTMPTDFSLHCCLGTKHGRRSLAKIESPTNQRSSSQPTVALLSLFDQIVVDRFDWTLNTHAAISSMQSTFVRGNCITIEIETGENTGINPN